MPYDEQLAARIRDLVAGEPGVTEQRMFGGLAFLVDGHMAVAAGGQGAMLVRVDPDAADALLAEAHVEPMEMRGRALRGWLHVGLEAVRTERQLESWVDRGVAFTRSLPPKR